MERSDLKIKQVLKGSLKAPLIIAETAFSHEGSSKYLKDLILQLKNQDNIALKLQILINKKDYLTIYNNIYDKVDEWLLTAKEWDEIIDYAHSLGVNVIVAALDLAAIQVARRNNNKILALEIHPSCISDKKLLNDAIEFCKLKKLPLILGISGFDFAEIDYLLEKYLSNIDKSLLVFMYGFQNYPTNISELNLKRLKLYENKFNVKVGYADHTKYDDLIKDYLISMVYGIGINIIELHCVLEYGVKRLDFVTAYNPSHIIAISDKLELLYRALGKEHESMNDSEKNYAINFRKIPVYNENFNKGHLLREIDISFKRSNLSSEYTLNDSDNIIGKRINRKVRQDKPILKKELL